MARGGVNKALVIEARQALLTKGQNPSIDAVRVELGNTGSKSTIHRYLKEIEESEATHLNDEALLSQPIRELVSRLAAQLKEETDERVLKAETRAKSRIDNLEHRLSEKKQENESLANQLTESEATIQKQSTELQDLSERNNQLSMQLNSAAEEAASLNTVLEEKQNQIDSLEEKHIHSREALEHYRQSVKEQRDQDIRQHQQQLQLLQVEIRRLGESISVKQTDITQLNKDNARFVTELTTVRRNANDMESKALSNGRELEELRVEIAALKGSLTNAKSEEERLLSELDDTAKKLEEVTALNNSLTIERAKLESETEVKSEMLDKLLEEK